MADASAAAMSQRGTERVLSKNLIRRSALAGRLLRAARTKGKPMHPLLFVNWSSVNVMFRSLMWLVAIVLAVVVVVHFMSAAAPVHHSLRSIR